MKRILQLAVGFLLLAALLFSLVILIKPGAAIFYARSPMDTQALTRNGIAFEYAYPVNTRIYDPYSLLVLEDQQVLEPATAQYTMAAGTGTFAIADIGGQGVTILFAPTTPGDPATNGHSYRIYIRPHLISTSWGGRFSLILGLGWLAFFASILFIPQKRAVLFGSPLGVVRLWFDLFDRPIIDSIARRPALPPVSRKSMLFGAAINVVLIAFFYVLMEWLFQVTKPSFMDILSLGEKINTLMGAGLAVALLGLLALPVSFLLDMLLSPVIPVLRKYVYYLPAAFLGSCLSIILIDNFTYTVLNFGIVSAKTLVRVLYGILFVAIFGSFLRRMAASPPKPGRGMAANRLNTISATAIFSISAVLAAFTFKPETGFQAMAGQNPVANNHPNIILFGTDGLDAASMSVYGYERDTTPFISELARTSLVSQNNFTNASHSMGSDTALLTGKLPFDTRVLFPPDTLKGTDRYQHLPGMLMREGYRTVSLGVPYYVDVRTINISNAFDAVNCQDMDGGNLLNRLSDYGYDDPVYLLTTMEERITERLNHIFFVKEMENPFAIVTQQAAKGMTDGQRIECLRSYLDEVKRTGQPLFAHVHLMGTHGARFTPNEQVFSKGKEQDELWMTDFYDDAILDYDTEVAHLVQYLNDLSLYDNTILILYTDHGMKYYSDKRLPLIMHFPQDDHAGSIVMNTQNLDIAPTILDYLGVEIPTWMDGSSLLGNLDPRRLILAGHARNIEAVNSGRFAISPEAFKPPFYQFGGMTVIQCQKVYAYDLVEMKVETREVAGYPDPCAKDALDSPDVVREKVRSYLAGFGFQLPDNW